MSNHKHSEKYFGMYHDVLDRQWIRMINKPELQALLSGAAGGSFDASSEDCIRTSYFLDDGVATSSFPLPCACSFSQYSFIGSSNIYRPLITPNTDPNSILLNRDAPDRRNDGLSMKKYLSYNEGIGMNR